MRLSFVLGYTVIVDKLVWKRLDNKYALVLISWISESHVSFTLCKYQYYRYCKAVFDGYKSYEIYGVSYAQQVRSF